MQKRFGFCYRRWRWPRNTCTTSSWMKTSPSTTWRCSRRPFLPDRGVSSTSDAPLCTGSCQYESIFNLPKFNNKKQINLFRSFVIVWHLLILSFGFYRFCFNSFISIYLFLSNSTGRLTPFPAWQPPVAVPAGIAQLSGAMMTLTAILICSYRPIVGWQCVWGTNQDHGATSHWIIIFVCRSMWIIIQFFVFIRFHKIKNTVFRAHSLFWWIPTTKIYFISLMLGRG